MARLPGRLPVRLAQNFEVRLPWHGGPVGGQRSANGRIVLRLDGGIGFGLGDHPTTQGAAMFLERALRESRVARRGFGTCLVMDWGCGSGVLALCAAHLGAAAVGVDIDTEAVSSARRSASLNFPQHPQAGTAGWTDFRAGPADFAAALSFAKTIVEDVGPFDIIVSNMPREPLLGLAPALAAIAKPGAELALTGIRCKTDGGAGDDAAAVRATYSPEFDSFHDTCLPDGWLLIEARRWVLR